VRGGLIRGGLLCKLHPYPGGQATQSAAASCPVLLLYFPVGHGFACGNSEFKGHQCPMGHGSGSDVPTRQ